MNNTTAIEESDNKADSVSIIIPFYNEEDNALPLIDEVQQAMLDFDLAWELIVVDDGSADKTLQQLNNARQHYGKHIHVIELMRNFGQTAAMQA
ncbi:MAG TPA: glycosyltransferase, partial [Thiothrix sp.]|nr:glycosyltransferase [Thiothrix sp.]